ncbi:hypothetical protein Tco_0381964 [Tanacetum coccineum]
MRNAMSSQLGYQHRNHQYKLHLHYKEYKTKEEAMTHPPKVGTLSLARRVDMSRREGKEVSEIDQFKMAHYSKKRKGMINEKANIIWNELRAEEATLSCTPAEICLKKLGYIPGHIKGRCASTQKILEKVNLRSELKVMKESQIKLQEENKATKEKVDYLLEEKKKMAQLLQQFKKRLEAFNCLSEYQQLQALPISACVNHLSVFESYPNYGLLIVGIVGYLDATYVGAAALLN